MKYHLRYRLDVTPNGLTKDELVAQDEAEEAAHPDVPERPWTGGACTAALVVSILFPPDGSYSTLFVSLDGRTGEPLNDFELFKAWAMLARRLSQSETLPASAKASTGAVFQSFCDAIQQVPLKH